MASCKTRLHRLWRHSRYCPATPAADGGLVKSHSIAADFGTPLTIDNPYSPLAPSTCVIYSEVSEAERVFNEFLVTDVSMSDAPGSTWARAHA